MDTIIVIVVALAAAWYLYRRVTRMLKAEGPACGCGGCDNCPTPPQIMPSAPETWKSNEKAPK